MRHESFALAGLCIVFPQEELALLCVACVEVLALVRALFLDEEEESGFVTVACIKESKFKSAKERMYM